MGYLGIDIGGTWIKAVMAQETAFARGKLREVSRLKEVKIQSPLKPDAEIHELIFAFEVILQRLEIGNQEVQGIGISTAGIVNYHGNKVLKAAPHLNILEQEAWQEVLEEKFQCPVTLINDADAAAIGLAELGYLKGNKTIGIMSIGTGLGFSVWKNGRRWRPGKSLTLLGSIKIQQQSLDGIASASRLANKAPDDNLIDILTAPEFEQERQYYLNNLVDIINSASIIYRLDEVIICGGLANAVKDADYSLKEQLETLLATLPPELDSPVKALVAHEGNTLQLMGAVSLAKAEAITQLFNDPLNYNAIASEQPYNKDLRLEQMSTEHILQTFFDAELEAAHHLKKSLKVIETVIEAAIPGIHAGGRIIYVGAGTSGRIAAMDAVELNCTYGFPEERAIALISGGISDAAIEIESDFEEDASAIPEMLLLNIEPNDMVIGISASGTAKYVQSALAFAKSRGALTVMIQSYTPKKSANFYDYIVPMHSGSEVVAGSTRMKAGTATKKILNMISSTMMIRLGKVAGSYMVDMGCFNQKLVERACYILKLLYNLNEQEALKKLTASEMHLGAVIHQMSIDSKKLKKV